MSKFKPFSEYDYTSIESIIEERDRYINVSKINPYLTDKSYNDVIEFIDYLDELIIYKRNEKLEILLATPQVNHSKDLQRGSK